MSSQVASASPGGPGAKRPLPTIGQFDPGSPRPLTGDELQRSLAKQKLADEHWKAAEGTAGGAKGLHAVANAYVSRNLGVAYQRQVNEVYCGPATMAMIASFLKIGWSGTPAAQQAAAARLLGATNAGTAWFGADNVPAYRYSSWYPMADALNYLIYRKTGNTWYSAATVSGIPTSAQVAAYQANLKFDVDANHPMALNQYSGDGFQLPYQPNYPWQHWLVARGYEGGGVTTIVNDPGWPKVGENARVRSHAARQDILNAVGGHGYIW
ncbi:C39 family peptidase [Jatrophihabitans telluris]|uniref:C39 family peptidase n=1 Tax=Jatrophihabitans telluris TaxID=2038343 RepID=A0ABY4R1E1_9ACTN|nr:C39 family peptidase [Jatrophihabitans telluris]UQX89287.1 C39 family peptidase [Jatrophihabitans telluris]